MVKQHVARSFKLSLGKSFEKLEVANLTIQTFNNGDGKAAELYEYLPNS